MNAWPLTFKEKMALRKKVLPTVSMEKLVRKYANGLELASSSIFTHKCICPSKDHKGGGERTPSFYFSEETNTYKCFGCGIWGDAFDFINLIRGTPQDIAVEQYVKTKNIDVGELSHVITTHFDISELNYDLSVQLREHLKSTVGTEEHTKESNWTDSTFKRIDERFSKLTNEDYESARRFYMQILMELARRKI